MTFQFSFDFEWHLICHLIYSDILTFDQFPVPFNFEWNFIWVLNFRSNSRVTSIFSQFWVKFDLICYSIFSYISTVIDVKTMLSDILQSINFSRFSVTFRLPFDLKRIELSFDFEYYFAFSILTVDRFYVTFYLLA